MDLPCPLQAAADDEPNAPALLAGGFEIRYDELNRLAAGTAHRLTSLGVREGDRVALCLDAGWQAVVLMLAAIRAGAVACPLSTRLPVAALANCQRHLAATLTVSDRPLRDAVEPDRLIDRSDAVSPPIPVDRPVTAVFTSGSTGAARAALHTFGNHHYSAVGSNQNIALAPGDRWLLSLPLYHVGGIAILYRCMLGRAAVVLTEDREPLADPGVTHVSMVSTQLQRALRAGGRGIHPKKAVLLGGSAISPGLLDAAVELGLPIHTSYGLTEMASQVAATPPEASRDDLRTSGRVLPFREARIDERGEIYVRGRTRFEGYIEGSTLTRPFDPEGWFATGDLGRFDERGRLTILGRLDNMFVSGGENILPEEIEAALEHVATVQRAVVVAVEDEEYGMRPVAFVDMGDGAPDAARLREAVEAVLPRFMVPDAFYPWPADAGAQRMKIDRRGLRQRAAALRADDG